MTKMKKLTVSVIAAAVTFVGATACNGDSGGASGNGDGDRLLISLIAKGTDDHWTLVRTGAMAAGEDLDVEVNYNAPDTENEGDRQLNMVQTAVNNGSDGIGIAPQDGLQDSAPLLIEEAADIPFVIFDTPLPGSDATIATIASDNPDIDAMAATGIYATVAIADEAAARGGDIVVVGVDAGEDVLTQLEEGKIDGIVAQNPYAIGYQTVEVLVAAARGELPGEDVIYTDSLWITADNINDPEVREALGLD